MGKYKKQGGICEDSTNWTEIWTCLDTLWGRFWSPNESQRTPRATPDDLGRLWDDLERGTHKYPILLMAFWVYTNGIRDENDAETEAS